jgi:hypothetical protein
MLRADHQHPWYHLNSDIAICTLPVRDKAIIRYRFPFNGGKPVEAYLESYLFGSQLRGYFHTSFTEIYTGHLLSLLPDEYVLLPVNAILSVFVFIILIYFILVYSFH